MEKKIQETVSRKSLLQIIPQKEKLPDTTVMKKNMGKTDKILRMLLGIAIIVAGAQLNSIWGVLGMIPVISAQTGFCPAYLLFGINTLKKKH